MTICYNFASRSRPTAFFETLDNIIALSGSKDFFVAAKLDHDDPLLNDYLFRLSGYPKITTHLGFSKSKIDAINRNIQDIPSNTWDILVNISDDQRFLVNGFDLIIREHIEYDCLLHFPDSFKGDKLCTMSIMDKVYYDRFGYVYHPAYNSLWADDEAQEVAKILGKYKYVDIPIFDHLHYSNGKATKDALYRRNDTYKRDRAVFEQRKERNFDL